MMQGPSHLPHLSFRFITPSGVQHGRGHGPAVPQRQRPALHPLVHRCAHSAWMAAWMDEEETEGRQLCAGSIATARRSIHTHVPTLRTTATWHGLKYYFAVNHHYVRRKLLTLLFPFRKRQWRRWVPGAPMDSSCHEKPTPDHFLITVFLPPPPPTHHHPTERSRTTSATRQRGWTTGKGRGQGAGRRTTRSRCWTRTRRTCTCP